MTLTEHASELFNEYVITEFMFRNKLRLCELGTLKEGGRRGIVPHQDFEI